VLHDFQYLPLAGHISQHSEMVVQSIGASGACLEMMDLIDKVFLTVSNWVERETTHQLEL
jgi:hypothetical protein